MGLLAITHQPRWFCSIDNYSKSKPFTKHNVSSTLWDSKTKFDCYNSSDNMNLRFKYFSKLSRANFINTAAIQDDNISFPITPSADQTIIEDIEMEGYDGLANLTWVDLHLPKEAQPYARLARLDRPIVTWLYVWPCFWGIALAASPGKLPDIALLALFGIASLPIRGYSCTINDILDREMDQKVHRSKQRPIASGAVTPLQGTCFLFLQLFTCLGILLPALNNYSKVVGIPFFPLMAIYPLMKRITYWPQAYLGVALNSAALVGWSAVKGSLDLPIVLPLYISLILWTLSYDTIYAHQDRAEDVKAGVKSTAVLFGDSTRIWISIFNIACIGCLALSGYNAKIGWPFYASLVPAFAHLSWQIITVDLSNSTECKNMFISNIWVGAIVFIGTCLGRLLN